MIWIDHKKMRRLPVNGQEVWYYLPALGVFRGTFRIDKSHEGMEMAARWGLSTNLFVCGEVCGTVDSDDVPMWMPYEEGSARPAPPYDKDEWRREMCVAIVESTGGAQ